jgi:hypothetical protein
MPPSHRHPNGQPSAQATSQTAPEISGEKQLGAGASTIHPAIALIECSSNFRARVFT